MPVPYAVTGGRYLTRQPLLESIYCPECEKWFKGGSRTYVEGKYVEHLATAPDPTLCSPEPY